MEKVELSISEVMGDAWDLVKKNWLMLSLIMFLMFVVIILPGVALFVFGDFLIKGKPASEEQISAFFTNPIFLAVPFLIMVICIGVYKMILNIASGETDRIEFSAFKMPVMIYVKCLALMIIFGILDNFDSFLKTEISVVIGFVLLIPQIFLTIRLGFAEIYLLDNPEMGIFDSIKASWNMTKGNFWALLGLFIVACLAAVSGVCLCCVGQIFTMNILFAAQVFAYLTIKKNLD